MIGYLQGSLLQIRGHVATIVVQGIGYEVELHERLVQQLPKPNETVSIYTHQHVREDALTLFGFIDADEKQLFQHLIKVNGVGPKLAVAILSSLDAASCVHAICNEDYTVLQQVKGLGAKVAKRLVMDLKTPLQGYHLSLSVAQAPIGQIAWQDAVMVLTRLGYKAPVAEKIVHKYREEAADLDHLIRLSLKHISSDKVGSL